MKNNIKLIMETWRKFLNEGPIMDNPYIESEPEPDEEPDEGYFDYDQNPDGFDPDAFEEPSTVTGETESLPGEPPFEDTVPVSDPHLSGMGDDVVDTDELHYEQKDAAMTPEEEEAAFEERYGDDGADVLDNPYGDDDGPY